MYTVWHCVWFIGKTMTVSLFLQHPDSEPPGMIINVIIKHLLPTAPAVSLSPLDPGDHREGEQEGEGGRDTGGARGRGWSAESSKSEGVTVTLLDSFTPARGCSVRNGRQRVKLCDPRTKGTRRTEQSDAGKEAEGTNVREGPKSSLTSAASQSAELWLPFHLLFYRKQIAFFIKTHIFFSLCYSFWINFWINLGRVHISHL